MTKRIKSILKKRSKIERESKKGLMKRKVVFKENKEKYYHLTDLERYEKINCWDKILRDSEKYYN